MGLIDTAIQHIEPRKLPIYLLIDTSSYMKGDRIESVKSGIDDILGALRNDPYALETVHISIITYGRHVEQLLPLTPIYNIQVPDITTDEYGPTHMGTALEMLLENVEKEVKKCTLEHRGDYKPILFILTDGQPTNKMPCNQIAPKVKSNIFQKVIYYSFGAKLKTEYFKFLTDDFYQIDALDWANIMQCIKWHTGLGFTGVYKSGVETTEYILGPPPEDLNIVI